MFLMKCVKPITKGEPNEPNEAGFGNEHTNEAEEKCSTLIILKPLNLNILKNF